MGRANKGEKAQRKALQSKEWCVQSHRGIKEKAVSSSVSNSIGRDLGLWTKEAGKEAENMMGGKFPIIKGVGCSREGLQLCEA